MLREGELQYFSKQSLASSSGATSVRFPVKRIRAVNSASQGDGKEFEVYIGRSNRRKYQLKAATSDSAKAWITAIQSVVNQYASNKEAMGGSMDSQGTSSDSEQIGGSSLNDNSSSKSIGNPTTTSESEGAIWHANGPLAPSDPLWEQPDVSGEELDALFAEWFSFLDDPRAEIKAGRMIDAASRAVSDLWAVLGSLPRGEDVVFADARTAINIKINSAAGERQRSTLVVGEYVMRVCQKFLIWLNRRPMNPEDIPVLIEWLARLQNHLGSIPLTDVPAESTPSPTHSDRGSIVAPPEKWAKAIISLIRKLGCEWEVSLIELLQRSMPPDSLWDLPFVGDEGYLPPIPHGACKFVPPPVLLGAPSKPILSTSWSGQYIAALTERCLSRSTKGTPWSVAYPICVETLTVHAANAMVAALNACWREFKRRSSLYSAHGSTGRVKTVIKNIKNLTGRLSISSPTRTAPEDARPSTPPPTTGGINVEKENMIAFGNEATLVSVLCQHASGIAEFRAASPTYVTCLESLSTTFASSANEVAKAIVRIHFLKANSKLIMAAFDPKCLAVRIKIPITETLDAAKTFLDSLPTVGCHDLLRYLIVGQVMQGVSNAYVTSLIRHKPKMAKFSRLAAVVAEDEGLFFTMFRDLGRPATEINTAIDQISHVRAVLAEKNLAPPAKGGMALLQQCVELTKVIQSSQRAVDTVKALLEIKGITKADRKDVMFSISACMQRSAHSPSPEILDLSHEEDEPRDHSGFSSNPSSRNEDESF